MEFCLTRLIKHFVKLTVRRFRYTKRMVLWKKWNITLKIKTLHDLYANQMPIVSPFYTLGANKGSFFYGDVHVNQKRG